MDKKSILIFGAGLNQLTLINEANEIGLTTIVIDIIESPPGKAIADYYYCVNGDDYKTTLEIAKRHAVAGLVTSQMEKPMRLMAKLAKELNLIFHSPQVVEQCLDKWLMKKALQKRGVSCANGVLISRMEEITSKKISSLQFPLVIKPKDGTSSQGVYKVESLEEILQYRPITMKYSKGGEVIIEEFLDGPEISVESITFNGASSIVQYTKKFVTPFPRTVEMGHLQPAQLNENEKIAVDKVVKDAIIALGIDNSASHTEVKLTPKGPKIVEVGARLGGDFISSFLVKNSCGVDMDRAAIQVTLGEKPNLEPTEIAFTFIKYLELPIGKRVKSIHDWTQIMNNPGVVFANISIPVGQTIELITESRKRPGFIIVKGEKKEEVLKLADSYLDKMKKFILFEE